MQVPINGDMVAFREELVAEMGDEALVDEYLRAFYEACGGDLQKASQMVMKFTQECWGPLFQAWLKWVFETTGDAPLVLLLRDAWPAGKLIQRGVLGKGRKVTPLYLSRAMLGIEDETREVPESEDRRMLHEYIAPIREEGAILVDTGAWGTIVNELYVRYGLKLQSRYLFSHNPWIPGFVNGLGMPDVMGEVFCDSVEVLLAKRHRRIKNLRHAVDPEKADRLVRTNGHSIEAVRTNACFVAYMLHEAAKMGIFHSQMPSESELLHLLRVMTVHHITSRETGEWTGILPRHTPTWGKGEAFIRDYPEELKAVNPAYLLPGGYPENRPQVNLRGLVL